MGFELVEVIWHNWVKSGLNMEVAATRAPVDSWGPLNSQKFGHWPNGLLKCKILKTLRGSMYS